MNIWKFGQKYTVFWKRAGIAWDSCTQYTASIGTDNHPTVHIDTGWFIICTLNMTKLPDHTQLEWSDHFTFLKCQTRCK